MKGPKGEAGGRGRRRRRGRGLCHRGVKVAADFHTPPFVPLLRCVEVSDRIAACTLEALTTGELISGLGSF